MVCTFDTYPSEYGIGYRIFCDGQLTVLQPFKPGVPGFVGMTEAEATAEAEAEIARMSEVSPLG